MTAEERDSIRHAARVFVAESQTMLGKATGRFIRDYPAAVHALAGMADSSEDAHRIRTVARAIVLVAAAEDEDQRATARHQAEDLEMPPKWEAHAYQTSATGSCRICGYTRSQLWHIREGK